MPKTEKKEDKVLVEIKRHNKVLMEHMEKQVKTIAEQHGSISQDISEIKSDVDGMKSELGTVKSELGTVKSELGTVKSELGTVKSELGTVKSELGTVKIAVMENSRHIKDLKAGQQRIEQKLDITLTDYEQRIKRVEEKVSA